MVHELNKMQAKFLNDNFECYKDMKNYHIKKNKFYHYNYIKYVC